jgi:hypothetical protein
MNECIDFMPIIGPYSRLRWAMLYVYGMYFKDGVLLSVN